MIGQVREAPVSNNRIVMLSVLLATGIAFSTKASAATLHTTQFISTPTYFNGFEEIGSSPNYIPSLFLYRPVNAPYSEGGITVKYVGSGNDNNGMSVLNGGLFPGQGNFSWYGPGYGYTDVMLTSGDQIRAIQFLFNTGGGGVYLNYQLLDNGLIVATGSTLISILAGSYTAAWYGFSGDDFNEVRLQVQRFSDQFNPGVDPALYPGPVFDTGAFDSIGAVPTPISCNMAPYASWPHRHWRRLF